MKLLVAASLCFGLASSPAWANSEGLTFDIPNVHDKFTIGKDLKMNGEVVVRGVDNIPEPNAGYECFMGCGYRGRGMKTVFWRYGNYGMKCLENLFPIQARNIKGGVYFYDQPYYSGCQPHYW